MFSNRQVGKTLWLTVTQGLRSAEDGLKDVFGNVFDFAWSVKNKLSVKFRLRVDEIQGKVCLTNFHGMSLDSR